MAEDNPVVRIEVEYRDGTVEQADGADAAAIWKGFHNGLAVSQIHGVPYRGPKLQRKPVEAPGVPAGPLPKPTTMQCSACGWTGSLGQCRFRHVPEPARPRRYHYICPQCFGLGLTSVVSEVPIASLPPKGSP